MFHPISWTLNFLATCLMYTDMDQDWITDLCERYCVDEHREEPTDLMLTAEVSFLLFFFATMFYYGFVA